MLHDSVNKEVYTTGGQTQVPIFVTGIIKIDNAEIAVLDSDLGSIETQKKYVIFFYLIIQEITDDSDLFVEFMSS